MRKLLASYVAIVVLCCACRHARPDRAPFVPTFAAVDVGDWRSALVALPDGTSREIQYVSVDGAAVVEGDIVLGDVAEIERRTELLRNDPTGFKTEALAIAGGAHRWPNKTIPYCIQKGLPKAARVHDAIKHWEAKTPIRFQDGGALCTALIAVVWNHVNFVPGARCSSAVGFQGGIQKIELADHCATAAVIHEIGHTVGLWHEQSRNDRNKYVVIHTNNIKPEYRLDYEQRVNDGVDIGAYDFSSIMHYGAYNPYAAVDPTKPVMTTIPPGKPIGWATGLSARDIEAVKTMYP